MTVKDIISSIPGVPYYNNVVDDWDAKDYSWGVTKKVIEYATYLKDHPESLAKLPPAIVLNGKFEDGAHRVSAIWLLQQRMDPKNPLWKNAKLNVQFVKQGVAEGKLIESAVFLNPTTVIVGQAHGQPLELSPNTLRQIQAIAAKHGAYYEGNGTDRAYTKGQIDRYVGSWDDEVAKTANPNDPKWLYVLFANVDENNRVQRVGVDPKDTIFNRLLATAKDNSFQSIGYTSQALQKFLQMSSEGKYDFVKMSQQPATQENLTRFLKAGEALMWPSNWEQYPNKAGKIAKAATVDVRDQYLATRKAGVYVTGSGHLKAVQNITGKQGVAEGFSNDMSTEDMIAYLRQHHDTNLHQDYLNHVNTFNKFVLKDVPVNSIKTDLPGLDREKVEQYKQMDFSKAPPIVMGGGYILDGYHRANVAKALGIPTIKAYTGIPSK